MPQPEAAREVRGAARVAELYDDIGRSYSRTRREDPRIAAVVRRCLGDVRRIVNVGAGSGSYEPSDIDVVAVEPSTAMIVQRRGRSDAVVRAVAEALPLGSASFDAALAVLTLHHWTDPAAGLAELRRVACRQVVFFYEPLRTHDFWAIEYFPEVLDLQVEKDPPGERLVRDHLDVREIVPVLVPHDCVDGFGAAFWARPEAYLDPEVQAGMSWMALLPERARAAGTGRLRDALASGEWDRRHGHLRAQSMFDAGYRIALAG